MGRYAQMMDSKSESPSSLESIRFSAPETDDFEDDQKKYGSTDPRADKAVDHKYWEDLLWNCWHVERKLYYVLHGVRCGGGELTLTRDSFRLLPGEWETAEWNEIKSVRLDPHKDRLIGILRLSRVMRVTEEELPAGIFDSKDNSMLVPGAPAEQGVLFNGKTVDS